MRLPDREQELWASGGSEKDGGRLIGVFEPVREVRSGDGADAGVGPGDTTDRGDATVDKRRALGITVGVQPGANVRAAMERAINGLLDRLYDEPATEYHLVISLTPMAREGEASVAIGARQIQCAGRVGPAKQ